jgi:hypothetical protein
MFKTLSDGNPGTSIGRVPIRSDADAGRGAKDQWKRMVEYKWPSEQALMISSKRLAYVDGKEPPLDIEILKVAVGEGSIHVIYAIAEYLSALRKEHAKDGYITLMTELADSQDMPTARVSLESLYKNGHFGDPVDDPDALKEYRRKLGELMDKLDTNSTVKSI